MYTIVLIFKQQSFIAFQEIWLITFMTVKPYKGMVSTASYVTGIIL
jgi:hypothetical protein